MFKYKKMILYFITFLYIVLSIIELIKYLFVNSNLFGLIYLINTLLIILLLVPCTYNYKKYYSKIRISKLIIIVVFGIFNSFILNNIILGSMSYLDSSSTYIKKIFLCKNIFKPILYLGISIFTVFEFKLEKLLKKH